MATAVYVHWKLCITQSSIVDIESAEIQVAHGACACNLLLEST